MNALEFVQVIGVLASIFSALMGMIGNFIAAMMLGVMLLDRRKS